MTETCPNLGLLRTTFTENDGNLSELGLTSDYFYGKRHKPVRTWVYFGLLLREKAQTSPNLGLLRTTFAGKGTNLSELGSTSDYFCRKRHKSVRTWAYFGLLLRKMTETGPNLGLLRTTFTENDGNLSELRPTSDYFYGK